MTKMRIKWQHNPEEMVHTETVYGTKAVLARYLEGFAAKHGDIVKVLCAELIERR